MDILIGIGALVGVFALAALILFLIDLCLENKISPGRWVADLVPVNKQIAGRWIARVGKYLVRFFVVYFLYLGAVLPFVTRRKEEMVWVVGLPFALAMLYIWNWVKPMRFK